MNCQNKPAYEIQTYKGHGFDRAYSCPQHLLLLLLGAIEGSHEKAAYVKVFEGSDGMCEIGVE